VHGQPTSPLPSIGAPRAPGTEEWAGLTIAPLTRVALVTARTDEDRRSHSELLRFVTLAAATDLSQSS